MIICFDTNRPPIAVRANILQRESLPRVSLPLTALPHRLGRFVDGGKLISRANCTFPEFM